MSKEVKILCRLRGNLNLLANARLTQSNEDVVVSILNSSTNNYDINQNDITRSTNNYDINRRKMQTIMRAGKIVNYHFVARTIFFINWISILMDPSKSALESHPLKLENVTVCLQSYYLKVA